MSYQNKLSMIKKFNVDFRPYQGIDYKNIISAFTRVKSVLYQLPTGGGKSVIISKFVWDNQNKNILILSHRREILFQMKKHLENSKINVGLLIGSHEEKLNSNIIIASVRTVTFEKRLQWLLSKKFDIIIIDEAHRTRTASYENVLDTVKGKNKNLQLFGVTATPYRMDKKGLDEYYDELVLPSSDATQLIKDGYLKSFRIFYTPVNELDMEVSMSGSDYNVTALSTYMRQDDITKYLVDSYKKYGNNRQMIVFCVDKEHSKNVKNAYIKAGFTKIAHIDSDTSNTDREQILDDYKVGRIQIITCVETLTEGLDLPDTGCIQLARPTKSLPLYLQMIGRGSRPSDKYKDLVILDNAGCSVEHGTMTSKRHWSLNSEIDPSNPSKKNKMVGKKADGTYTDNKEEMEFLELVEMTPEEYLEKVSHNIESAKKTNENFDKQISSIYTEIAEFTAKSLGLDYKVEPRYKQIEFKLPNSDRYGFTITFRNGFPSINMPGYGSTSIKDLEQQMKLFALAGKISEKILSEDGRKKVTQKLAEMTDIEDNKINIYLLEDKMRQAQGNQFENDLSSRISKGEVFKSKTDLWIDDYFKGFSYNRTRFNNIVVDGKKLGNLNCVHIYHNNSLVHTVKYMRQEKLVSLLKDILK